MSRSCFVIMPNRDDLHYSACLQILDNIKKMGFYCSPYELKNKGFSEEDREIIKSHDMVILICPLIDTCQIYEIGFSDALDKPTILVSLNKNDISEFPQFFDSISNLVILGLDEAEIDKFYDIFKNILTGNLAKDSLHQIYMRTKHNCLKYEGVLKINFEFVSESEFGENITSQDISRFLAGEDLIRDIFMNKILRNREEISSVVKFMQKHSEKPNLKGAKMEKYIPWIFGIGALLLVIMLAAAPFVQEYSQYLIFAFGIMFLILILGTAILVPKPTPYQYTVFRILLALFGAGVATFIPGNIGLEISRWVNATGAIAIFVIIYFFSPSMLPEHKEAASQKSSTRTKK